MAWSFFDSSAVAKLYHDEPGTETVQTLLTAGLQAGSGNFISRLTVVEIQSVFVKKVRTGQASKAGVQLLHDRFLGDLRSRRLRVVALFGRHYQQAERLIQSYGGSHALRTLDALQLAVALDLKERGLADLFVSADKALCNVAEAAGLEVQNPEAV